MRTFSDEMPSVDPAIRSENRRQMELARLLWSERHGKRKGDGKLRFPTPCQLRRTSDRLVDDMYFREGHRGTRFD